MRNCTTCSWTDGPLSVVLSLERQAPRCKFKIHEKGCTGWGNGGWVKGANLVDVVDLVDLVSSPDLKSKSSPDLKAQCI